MNSFVHHGFALKQIRNILQINNSVFAELMKISPAEIETLENTPVIEDHILEKIHKVLNIPVSSIKNFKETTLVQYIYNNTIQNNENVYVGKNEDFNKGNFYNSQNPTASLKEIIVQLEKQIEEIRQIIDNLNDNV